MSLSLSQSKTAIGPHLTASFLGVGGAEPYAYSVRTGGAGGTIDSVTGVYTSPASVPADQSKLYDTVKVTDDTGTVVLAQILIGSPLILFCEMIQKEMDLDDGRVYLWDQKIMQPTDSDLYIAVSVPSCKPFGNTIRPDATLGWSNPVQTANMLATLDLDIMSRGPAARDRKEEVLLAFNSIYSQSQQETNSFYIGKLPPSARFTNLSLLDGAAIPYRFRISVNMQYAFTKTKPVDYFDTFQDVPVTTEP